MLKKILNRKNIIIGTVVIFLFALNLQACSSLASDTNDANSTDDTNMSASTAEPEQGAESEQDTESNQNAEINQSAEPEQNTETDQNAETLSAASVENEEQHKDSFSLIYNGIDMGMEISLKDCDCEYDMEDIKVFSYYVDDYDIEGYALYIEDIEHTSTIFPVKEYLIDESNEKLYLNLGMNSFERIYEIDFKENKYGNRMQNTDSMEKLISEAYELEFLDDGTDFEDLQVTFTGINENDEEKYLGGKATAIYSRTGKQYEIEWEIDTKTYDEYVRRYLKDMDIDPLYVEFLMGEKNAFYSHTYEGKRYEEEISYFEEVDCNDCFCGIVSKNFALVDMNNDGKEELIFDLYKDGDGLMFILGKGKKHELVCYDVFETHSSNVGFRINDNGTVTYRVLEDSQLYSYDSNGKRQELLFLHRENYPDTALSYGYYYLNGNEKTKCDLQSEEEFEEVWDNLWWGEKPIWYDCGYFIDIAKPRVNVDYVYEMIINDNFEHVSNWDWKKKERVYNYLEEQYLVEWVQRDLNEDGILDLVLQEDEPIMNDRNVIVGIFAGEEDGARCIYWDAADYSEYSFLGKSGELMHYTYSDKVGCTIRTYLHYDYDTDWNEIKDYTLSSYDISDLSEMNIKVWKSKHPDMMKEGKYYRKQVEGMEEEIISWKKLKAIYQEEMQLELESEKGD